MWHRRCDIIQKEGLDVRRRRSGRVPKSCFSMQAWNALPSEPDIVICQKGITRNRKEVFVNWMHGLYNGNVSVRISFSERSMNDGNEGIPG